jgi:hypothetical protein
VSTRSGARQVDATAAVVIGALVLVLGSAAYAVAAVA